MASQIYKYPKEITSDYYEHRNLTITVKLPPENASVTAAIEKAFSTLSASGNLQQLDAIDLNGVKANLDSNDKSVKDTTKATIVLPLPNSFSDSQSHGWSTETGVMAQMAQNVTQLDIGQGIADISARAGSMGGIVGSGIATAGGVAGKLMSGVTVDKALGSAAATSGVRKPLIDPGYFQNYSGSEPRTFQMEFDLVPKDAEEANSIVMIILKLKEFSSPTRMKGGVSLLAPYYFNLKISNEYVSMMAKINRVVLKDLSVDYGADGAMQQFHDGMPKQIKLSLTWQEVDMSTAQDYNSRTVK